VPTFPQETVDAVLNQMNNEHGDDNLLISRAFGDPDAVRARMTTLDDRGGTWVYTVDGTDRDLTVPWGEQIGERAQIRREVVRLYELACGRLGVVPRDH